MDMRRDSYVTLLFAATLMLTACGSQTPEKETIKELSESSIQKAQTVTVERGDMQLSNSYDALVGPRVVQLTFEDDGIFGEYKVGIGDTVQEGDVLAVPDTEQLEEEIEAKERELSDLTVELEHSKTSMENQIKTLELYIEEAKTDINKIIYGKDKERVELQLRHLQETYNLEIAYCQKQLQKLKEQSRGNVIKAPFDGTIVALQEMDDSMVEDVAIDTALYYVAIADNSTLYARCDYVSQSLVNSLSQIVFWKDGVEYPAAYVPMTEKIYREMNNNGETLFSEFLVENQDGVISAGDYGKIKLISKEKKGILLIPETTLMADASGSYVYRNKDGVQERVSVEIGSKDGIYVEIVSGLEEGDVIYVQE